MTTPQTKPLTYCNPLPLPSYQRGAGCLKRKPAPGYGYPEGWMTDTPRDYREMADPTCIMFEGKWYLFPSCGQLWVSEDFVNWTFHPIEPFIPGYAPTVVQHGQWLYMSSCASELWRAPHPFGPWEKLGHMLDENGNATETLDPMLFVDDDSTMYCYSGLGGPGIFVAPLRADDPTRYAAPKVKCLSFDTTHAWERFGESHQYPGVSYCEGSWMTKHNGRYYVQYSAPGTELKSYSVGCYVADKPTGPFRYQERNPILTERFGLINGCGHHSIVPGPGGTLWCFYSTLVRIEHKFERRVGMDPVGFDERGNMYVNGPTETPQFAPGAKADPAREGNDAGLLPLSVNEYARASSYAPGHEPMYAVDNYIRTWWEAAGPGPQWLEVNLWQACEVHSARTMFADRGLDYDNGAVPGPYKYRIEGSLDGKSWTLLLDKSGNNVEQHIVYDTWTPQRAKFVRITVLEAPRGLRIGLWEFTVFGKA